MKAIIVEDETPSRDFLLGLLQTFCPQVDIVDCSKTVTEAVAAVRTHEPDVVFLDIQLSDERGFELLEKTNELDYNVIFTTAYDEYAVQAFRYAALDYLMKPIDPVMLKEAIERVDTLAQQSQRKNLEVLFQNLSNVGGMEQIALPTTEGFQFARIVDILRIEADRAYSSIHFTDGEQFLATRNLRELEQLLGRHAFFRIHKSHLINLNHLAQYDRTDGGTVILRNGECIPVARSKKNEFTDYIKGLKQ